MKASGGTLRVAVVGCGQIADAHLQEIQKISCARLVGVCDVHLDLAEQAALRFDVPHWFDNIDRLLEDLVPDVVHLTTPAQTHSLLTVKLLQAGVHVYVEKPLTVDGPEAERVLEAARQSGRLVCLGHDQLFDPAWLQCRELVGRGAIGDVAHVESVLGYPLSGQFGRQVTADRNHWVRRLPGGLFQNTISHPLYRITEFLRDESPAVEARWFAGRPADAFPSELNVHLRGEAVTGSLLFSTRIEPQRVTRVYGSRGMLEVDLDAQVVRRARRAVLPGAFEKLETPWRAMWDAAGNLQRNVRRFLKSDIHYFGGMRSLFEQFYRSILDEGPPPIPYGEMLRVTRLMDAIFHCCPCERFTSAKRTETDVIRGRVARSGSTGQEASRTEAATLQETRS